MKRKEIGQVTDYLKGTTSKFDLTHLEEGRVRKSQGHLDCEDNIPAYFYLMKTIAIQGCCHSEQVTNTSGDAEK